MIVTWHIQTQTIIINYCTMQSLKYPTTRIKPNSITSPVYWLAHSWRHLLSPWSSKLAETVLIHWMCVLKVIHRCSFTTMSNGESTCSVAHIALVERYWYLRILYSRQRNRRRHRALHWHVRISNRIDVFVWLSLWTGRWMMYNYCCATLQHHIAFINFWQSVFICQRTCH